MLTFSISYWDLIKFPFTLRMIQLKEGMGMKGDPKTGWRHGDFADKSIVLYCLRLVHYLVFWGEAMETILRNLEYWKFGTFQTTKKVRLIYMDLQMTHRQRKHENISKVEDCLINLAWTSLRYQSRPDSSTNFAASSKKYHIIETCLSLYVFVCECTRRVSWSADFCMLDHTRGYNRNQWPHRCCWTGKSVFTYQTADFCMLITHPP